MMSKGLYDAKPYAYMAFGALCTAVLDSPVKYVPALLFVAAGILVISWRHAGARRRRQEVIARAHRDNRGSRRRA